MMSIHNELQVNNENSTAVISYFDSETEACEQSLATAIEHSHPTTQLLLANKFITHIPEAGLNPLVDAAANVFSMMGKIKHIKWYQNLSQLHTELVQEIESFQEAVKAYSYNAEYISEYIPIACYALCVTLDDIIADTAWGRQGKWTDYSLVATFIPEPPSQSSFFIILERLIRDPDVYIDVMEFMYICLNFGFKCRVDSNSLEFNHEQLDQITNSLYRRIRAYRGSFSKALSPFPLKVPHTEMHTGSSVSTAWVNLPLWLSLILVIGIIFILYYS